MTEIFCRRMGPALQPIDDEGRDLIQKIGTGEQVKVKISRPRNIGHHRKMFALFRFAFDHWEPPQDPEIEAKYGMAPEKSFDNFWRELLCIGGYYHLVWNTDGALRKRPNSISFSNMGQEEFDEVYRAMLRVAWNVVFQHIDNYDDEQVLANALLEFE